MFSFDNEKILFEPKDIKNKSIALDWQTNFYKLNGCWPIAENANIKNWSIAAYNLWIVLVLIMYMVTVAAELYYFIVNYNIGLETLMENASTTIMGIQFMLRLFHLAFQRNKFRNFANNFYHKIHIRNELMDQNDDNDKDKETNEVKEKILRDIGRSIYVINIVIYSYIGALLFFIGLPIVQTTISKFDVKAMPYKMIFPYQIDNILIYIFTFFYTSWVGVSVVTLACAEIFFITLTINHLAGRFVLLQKSIKILHKTHREILKKNDSVNSSERMFIEIKALFHRNSELKTFGLQIQEIFSFRYFLIMLCNVVLLCLAMFQLSNSSASLNYEIMVKYAFWASGAVMEMSVLGFMGSILLETSEKMGEIYYGSNWEDILIDWRGDYRLKMRYLKLVWLGITLTQKPLEISGLGYFNMSIRTSFEAIRASASYYMFLHTMK